MVTGDSVFDLSDIYSENDLGEASRSYFNTINTIWVNIVKGYKDELINLYGSLKNKGTWNSTTISSKWNEYQRKRPHLLMIRDAYIKYIYPYKTNNVQMGENILGFDNSYLARLNGSKIYQRQQFLTYQTSYMDGKYAFFSDNGSLNFRTNQSKEVNLSIKSYAKTYISVRVGTNITKYKKVNAGSTVTFNDIQFGRNTYVYVNPGELIQSVSPINNAGISLFACSSARKLTNMELGHPTIENTDWTSTSDISIQSRILKELTIENIKGYNSSLNLENQLELELLNTVNTQTSIITLGSYAPLHTLKLNDCTGFTAKNITTLVNPINCSIEDVHQLFRLVLENCSDCINDMFKDAMIDYLLDHYNSSTQTYNNLPLTNARLININWTINNEQLFLLDKLLEVKGIDVNGNNTNNVCTITGDIYIMSAQNQNELGEVSSVKLYKYITAWPSTGLTIHCQEVPEYTIEFYDWDGTLLKQSICTQGHILTSSDYPARNPERAPDKQYYYDFKEWTGIPIDYL